MSDPIKDALAVFTHEIYLDELVAVYSDRLETRYVKRAASATYADFLQAVSEWEAREYKDPVVYARRKAFVAEDASGAMVVGIRNSADDDHFVEAFISSEKFQALRELVTELASQAKD